jgi:hypothetical protein
MEHYYQNVKGWAGFLNQYKMIMEYLPNDAVWVEVGCYCGKSLSWLMVEQANQNKNYKVYAVDLWGGDPKSNMDRHFREEAYNDFLKNLDPFIDEITIYREFSWNAARHFVDNSVDYVMLDAAHDYEAVYKDLEAWWPKIKNGGIIGGDDYADKKENGVNKAVIEFFNNKGKEIHLLKNTKRTIDGPKSKVLNWYVKK